MTADPMADFRTLDDQTHAALRGCENALLSAADREERMSRLAGRHGVERRSELADRLPAFRERSAR